SSFCFLLLVLFILFFFFQAEDGIRDRNVTGVQTCALPISPLIFVSVETPYYKLSVSLLVQNLFFFLLNSSYYSFLLYNLFNYIRSEERRVGKECRSQWGSAY